MEKIHTRLRGDLIDRQASGRLFLVRVHVQVETDVDPLKVGPPCIYIEREERCGQHVEYAVEYETKAEAMPCAPQRILDDVWVLEQHVENQPEY